MGMMKFEATPVRIDKGESKSGRPFYRILLDNGETIYAWSFNVIKDMKLGEAAEFSVDSGKDKRFLYVVNATPVESTTTPDFFKPDELDSEKVTEAEPVDDSLAPEPASKPAYKESTKEIQIARMSALKTAVEWATLYISDHLFNKEEIIEAADRFVKFIVEGK